MSVSELSAEELAAVAVESMSAEDAKLCLVEFFTALYENDPDARSRAEIDLNGGDEFITAYEAASGNTVEDGRILDSCGFDIGAFSFEGASYYLTAMEARSVN